MAIAAYICVEEKKNASRNIRLEMAPACLDYKERVAEGRKSRASIYLYGELARGQPSVMRRLYGCRVACVMVNCTSWSDMGLGGCEWPVLNIELEMSLLGWGLIVMDKNDVPTRSKKATFAFFCNLVNLMMCNAYTYIYIYLLSLGELFNYVR